MRSIETVWNASNVIKVEFFEKLMIATTIALGPFPSPPAH